MLYNSDSWYCRVNAEEAVLVESQEVIPEDTQVAVNESQTVSSEPITATKLWLELLLPGVNSLTPPFTNQPTCRELVICRSNSDVYMCFDSWFVGSQVRLRHLTYFLFTAVPNFFDFL
jgi:hypothetical protein